MTSSRLPLFPLLWFLIALQIVLCEGWGLGRPQQGDTLSEMIWLLRSNPVGRLVFLPLWCWLTWHFAFKAPEVGFLSWRDAVAVTIGVVWALAQWRL
jgi:hypothetical protein